jgi:hypothetical protein
MNDEMVGKCLRQVEHICVHLWHRCSVTANKKSLKIPKGQSESIYRRRTDNTMAKRKSTKGQTTIYKTHI